MAKKARNNKGGKPKEEGSKRVTMSVKCACCGTEFFPSSDWTFKSRYDTCAPGFKVEGSNWTCPYCSYIN